MDFKRANYSHNFLNAIETDHMAAWDMFVNELNEQLVNNTAAVREIMRKSGMRVQDKSTLKEMSDLIHEAIRTNAVLRKNLNKLILGRHKDQLISAEGGKYDTVYNNAAGDAAKGTSDQDPAQVAAIDEATEKLVGIKPNQNNLSVDKDTAKALGAQNLENKLKYHGVPDGKKFFTKPVKIGLAVIAGGLVIWGLYKVFKK